MRYVIYLPRTSKYVEQLFTTVAEAQYSSLNERIEEAQIFDDYEVQLDTEILQEIFRNSEIYLKLEVL